MVPAILSSFDFRPEIENGNIPQHDEDNREHSIAKSNFTICKWPLPSAVRIDVGVCELALFDRGYLNLSFVESVA